jgi:hypothetical protein
MLRFGDDIAEVLTRATAAYPRSVRASQRPMR